MGDEEDDEELDRNIEDQSFGVTGETEKDELQEQCNKGTSILK